jgi:pimeloyl-ACP methyl ester carboxylesterase
VSGLLARVLAPVTRRLVYVAGPTRLPAAGTSLHLSSGGVDLRGWVVNPGQERALVYFGGNSEGVEWLRPVLAAQLPEHTSYLLAYRGYGASGGRPSQAALTADGLALLDHVASRHPGLPDVIGRSLGSGVATQVAVRRRVRRLVLVTPFDSLAATAADLFPRLPAERLVHDRWDSAAVAGRLEPPVLVVRAALDDIVRPERTDRLLEALPAGTRVTDLPRAGHADLVDDPVFWPAVRHFLD